MSGICRDATVNQDLSSARSCATGIGISTLAPTDIRTALKEVPDWKKKGSTIVRTFAFKDFVIAMKFVNAVAKAAEKAFHHPDIDIRWNKVRLLLTTHDAGGLTTKDFAMATKCDAAAAKLV